MAPAQIITAGLISSLEAEAREMASREDWAPSSGPKIGYGIAEPFENCRIRVGAESESNIFRYYYNNVQFEDRAFTVPVKIDDH